MRSSANIGVSTACLSGNTTLSATLETLHEIDIPLVELGFARVDADDVVALVRHWDFDYLVHNYFPPPETPFVVNLASVDEEVRHQSLEQVLNSLEFCDKVGARLFSVHAGFRSDPDIGFRFDGATPAPYETSYSVFLESLSILADRADLLGVSLAVENNVVERHLAPLGVNDHLLLCDPHEFTRFLKDVGDRVSVLLDTGHMRVSAETLNFEMADLVHAVAGAVSVVHVHDNDGLADHHRLPVLEGEICRLLSESDWPSDPMMILESHVDTVEELLRGYDTLRSLGSMEVL